MKVVQLGAFGRPEEVVACVEVGDPGAPGDDEVLIEVDAFPINPADLLVMQGRYAVRPPLPARLGAECVGTVRAVGAAVAGFAVGDRVISLARENWVQQRRLKADEVVRLPPGGDRLQLAMLKVNPPTAHLMLTRYEPLAPGDWVIHNAANSAVGHWVIHLAREAGIRTVNVVRREGLEPALRALGADVVVVDGPDLAERVRAAGATAPIRLALDAVGGEAVMRLGDCLVEEATILNYGLLSGAHPCLRGDQTVFKRLWLTGFWLLPWLQRMAAGERHALYAMLAEPVIAGRLHVDVEATYAIEDIRAAVAHAARGGRDGKILVTPNGARP
ncbi:MAG: zinc-dependent alcohol dehydrogenase family protein [Gammaproteobacteria bacterium]|nr:zinc-dependent alcohol dehydrogenase family protein [Gammaproteobacteria bacterium]